MEKMETVTYILFGRYVIGIINIDTAMDSGWIYMTPCRSVNIFKPGENHCCTDNNVSMTETESFTLTRQSK